MRQLLILSLAASMVFVSACSKIKPNITHQYRLAAFSQQKMNREGHSVSILVSLPVAVGGYQTNEMLYVKRAYELNAFAENGWVSPPAEMMYPLIFQSLQSTGFFSTVASSTESESTTYRLDTQLIELHQNFLSKPSRLDFSAKIVLSSVKDNRVLASRIISRHIPDPSGTPYGGVIAANQALQQFTAEVSAFVVEKIKSDRKP